MRDLAGTKEACSINTATLGFQKPIRQTIDAIARAGFRYASPWRRELKDESIKAVAKHLSDAKIAVPGYYRSTFLPAADKAQRRFAIDDNKRAMDDAITLGAEYFPLVVGSLHEGSKNITEARKQVLDALPELLEYARRNGIKLAIEPLHPVYAADRSCILSLSHALDVCDAIEGTTREPSLGILFDVYHCWWDHNLPHDIARAGAQRRIFGFHVNDWLRNTNDILNDRGMMGDGVIDLRGIRGMVEAAGFNGPVEVEIFSANDWWKKPLEETLKIAAARLATST
jgi:sugar phosphate isomerase/epimerase